MLEWLLKCHQYFDAAVIEEDLGRPISEIFSSISPEPLAAASLGQVYKGTIRETGQTVAIKVQRPGMLEIIALDIFILRGIAWIIMQYAKTNSNLPALIDEWATSIYREMSYVGEMRNAQEFKSKFAHYTEVLRTLISCCSVIFPCRYIVKSP